MLVGEDAITQGAHALLARLELLGELVPGGPLACNGNVEFVLNGVRRVLDADTVTGRMRDVQPEPVREHAVEVDGVAYPVKQVFRAGQRCAAVAVHQPDGATPPSRAWLSRHCRGDFPCRVWCGATSTTRAGCYDRGGGALAVGGKRAGRVR